MSQIRHRTYSDIKEYVEFRAEEYGYELQRMFGWKSLRKYSDITDVVGTPKTQRVKPVEHFEVTYTGLPLHSCQMDHGKWILFDENQLPDVDAYDLMMREELFIPHALRVKAASEAFNFFSERFPTKISGAEFFQGLFELAALIPKLEQSLQRTVSSAYLTKKFGWDNLISDLRSFTSVAGSIRERMEFLKRTYGKPTKLRFKKPHLNPDSIGPGWTLTRVRGRGWVTKLVLESYTCEFTAGATLTQEMKHIDDFIGWLRAIVITLGLNQLATSIWKTTRLSFVVDWVVNVSGALTRLATVQPADRWDVTDVSSAVRVVAVFKVYQVLEQIVDVPDKEYFLGHAYVKRYSRAIGLPLDLSEFTPSSLNPAQLVLLTAMIGAK
jgi:hypothetical protein